MVPSIHPADAPEGEAPARRPPSPGRRSGNRKLTPSQTWTRKPSRAETVLSRAPSSESGFNSIGQVHSAHSTPRLLQDTSARRGGKKKARARFLDVLLGTRHGQWVGLLSVGCLLVCCGAVAWSLSGGVEEHDASLGHSLWMSWCLFFDPGTQTGISPDDPGVVRWVALIFSVLGFIYNLSVLGIIVETVRGLMRTWERERYKIVLNGHVLVLGWTDKTLFLIKEVIAKAENLGLVQQKVVILADIDEREMDEHVRDHIPDMKGHYVKCRRGCVFNPKDLMRVSVYSARDVIVLAREGSPDASDLEVVRVMVALAALPMELSVRVLAEVRCANMEPVVEALLPDVADGIHARSTINRLLCIMAASPVVGDCLASLCCFAYGDELYLTSVPALVGATFGQACMHFSRPVLIGLKPGGGQVVLAPPDGRIIESTDRLVLIAPDSHAINEPSSHPFMRLNQRMVTLSRQGAVGIASLLADERWDGGQVPLGHRASLANEGAAGHSARQKPGTFIVIGWPDDIGELLFTLDCVAPPGTAVHLLSERPVSERRDLLERHKVSLKNSTLQHYVGKCTSVEWLAALPLAEARAILVLAGGQGGLNSGASNAGAEAGHGWAASSGSIGSDSACLACAVTICGICDGRFGPSLACRLKGRIICEVLDVRTDRMLSRNRELGKRCVFFRSNALEMGLFAMAASDPSVFNTLMLLLSPVGCAGKLSSLTLEELLSEAQRRAMAEQGDAVMLSFWHIHRLVRDFNGGILAGWQKEDTGLWCLCPEDSRSLELRWSFKDQFLVIEGPRDGAGVPDSPQACLASELEHAQLRPLPGSDGLPRFSRRTASCGGEEDAFTPIAPSKTPGEPSSAPSSRVQFSDVFSG